MTSGLSLYWEVLKIEGLTNQDSMYLGDPELITFLDLFFFTDNNGDFDFDFTTQSSNEIDDIQGGGVRTSQNPGNVLARGNSSSSLTSPSFFLWLLALSLFVALIRK